jgi:hypothetical protein
MLAAFFVPEALQKQETSGVTRRQLDVFCECYANALAKELTADELRTALSRTDHVTQQMKDRVSGAAPACRRQAIGFRSIQTYLLHYESGTSLKAAGWSFADEV